MPHVITNCDECGCRLNNGECDVCHILPNLLEQEEYDLELERQFEEMLCPGCGSIFCRCDDYEPADDYNDYCTCCGCKECTCYEDAAWYADWH